MFNDVVLMYFYLSLLSYCCILLFVFIRSMRLCLQTFTLNIIISY
jgi:hypothetical protein